MSTDRPQLAAVNERPLPGTTVMVKVHPGLCEGWGNCHRWAPELYTLDEQGLIDLHVVEVPPELAEAAWLGAQSCPAGVITVLTAIPSANDSTDAPTDAPADAPTSAT